MRNSRPRTDSLASRLPRKASRRWSSLNCCGVPAANWRKGNLFSRPVPASELAFRAPRGIAILYEGSLKPTSPSPAQIWSQIGRPSVRLGSAADMATGLMPLDLFLLLFTAANSLNTNCQLPSRSLIKRLAKVPWRPIDGTSHRFVAKGVLRRWVDHLAREGPAAPDRPNLQAHGFVTPIPAFRVLTCLRY